jgi:hypothetical protein
MLRRIVACVLHQAACPYALAIVTAFFTFSVVGPVGGTGRTASSLLTMNPFYPVQVAVGLAAGYIIGRHFDWPFARWTWVVPALLLLISTIFAPIPAGLSRIGYLFGWSGVPRRGTIPLQLAATMPFYLSAAYSLAAWKGKRDRNRHSAVSSRSTT